ncbi:M55 family metallopeptidase [Streptomyces sp. SID3343]|uniref:M55 family metallopeptidase n=1 Tax=Streptomyces sp. SID3343 TaxID=2690260 RepID=UPI001367E4B4|nr:M55 family metallopeptidase [Streptomyces sp. SID3343]MYW01040.1 aminopeptidase [Streptomyces sp. SID3343]
MDVYISIDMEGVAGIATLDQIVRGGGGYTGAQKMMTGEANAAIEGAFAAGADTVLVNDSHGTMDNLIPEELDPRARVILGSPKAQCMAHGIGANHGVALFIGYHAAAGAPGVLAHTFSSDFTSVRLNGVPVTEAEVNALQAARHGVPIGLVSGDNEVCAATEKAFPGVITVPVKKAEGFTAANNVHPSVARDLIRAGAAAAVEKAANLEPLPLPEKFVLEVGFQIPLAAEIAAAVPGAERVDLLTVRCAAPDPDRVIDLIEVWYTLAAHSARSRLPILERR